MISAAVVAAGAERASIVVVARARRPPIKAIALFLGRVAETAGPGAEVILLLVGRKDGDAFARVADDDLRHWRNFQAIHRLRLDLDLAAT